MQEMEIRVRLAVILWARKFINKHNLVKFVQEKANQMLLEVKDFKKMFQEWFDEGLPPFWVDNGKLFSQEQYHKLLVHECMDHSKFKDLTKRLTRKVIIETLTDDFDIFERFLITQRSLPPIYYTQYVELEVAIEEMMDCDLLNHEQWKAMENFGKTKYRLHQ